jgi:hypothetical protein
MLRRHRGGEPKGEPTQISPLLGVKFTSFRSAALPKVSAHNSSPLDKIKLNVSHYLMLKLCNACDGL